MIVIVEVQMVSHVLKITASRTLANREMNTNSNTMVWKQSRDRLGTRGRQAPRHCGGFDPAHDKARGSDHRGRSQGHSYLGANMSSAPLIAVGSFEMLHRLSRETKPNRVSRLFDTGSHYSVTTIRLARIAITLPRRTSSCAICFP